MTYICQVCRVRVHNKSAICNSCSYNKLTRHGSWSSPGTEYRQPSTLHGAARGRTTEPKMSATRPPRTPHSAAWLGIHSKDSTLDMSGLRCCPTTKMQSSTIALASTCGRRRVGPCICSPRRCRPTCRLTWKLKRKAAALAAFALEAARILELPRHWLGS